MCLDCSEKLNFELLEEEKRLDEEIRLKEELLKEEEEKERNKVDTELIKFQSIEEMLTKELDQLKKENEILKETNKEVTLEENIQSAKEEKYWENYLKNLEKFKSNLKER